MDRMEKLCYEDQRKEKEIESTGEMETFRYEAIMRKQRTEEWQEAHKVQRDTPLCHLSLSWEG